MCDGNKYIWKNESADKMSQSSKKLVEGFWVNDNNSKSYVKKGADGD